MITPSKRLELLFLAFLPAFITILLVLFFLASKHIGGLNHFMPILPLIPIFYWGIAHARDMPYWFVFAIGLVMDAVMGQPMGLSSLLYVFFLFMLHTQYKYIHKEGFAIQWVYFSALLAIMSVLNWLMLSFFNSTPENIGPGIIQWILTIGCYPLLHKLFDGLYEYISSRRWQILHGL